MPWWLCWKSREFERERRTAIWKRRCCPRASVCTGTESYMYLHDKGRATQCQKYAAAVFIGPKLTVHVHSGPFVTRYLHALLS